MISTNELFLTQRSKVHLVYTKTWIKTMLQSNHLETFYYVNGVTAWIVQILTLLDDRNHFLEQSRHQVLHSSTTKFCEGSKPPFPLSSSIELTLNLVHSKNYEY